MDEAFQTYAAMATPRYTSYPTAPHFQSEFPERAYRDWLAALDPAEPISLYLNAPYCHSMCWCCGCRMKLASRYEPVAAYVRSLVAEIDLIAAALPPRMQVGHLHLGGGAPTALEPADLEQLMDAVRERFALERGAEIAIEADPRTLRHSMIDRIGALGFNRVSFCVQEFDPKVQAAINRIQPPETVRDAATLLRAVGVLALNFDLMFGLPRQTVETIATTVERCVEMRPERSALFGYAPAPWMAKRQRMIDASALPGASERLAQAETAAAALRRAGYQAIGLDHFALPDDALAIAAREGLLRRNFQGYTADRARTLIGFGASAISRTPAGYAQNAVETGASSRAIAAGSAPVAKGRALDDEDRLRGHVIERLMCDGAVDTIEAGALFGRAPGWCAAELAALAPMASHGFVSLSDGVVTMSKVGAPLARVVASAFDSYRRASERRHSVAV